MAHQLAERKKKQKEEKMQQKKKHEEKQQRLKVKKLGITTTWLHTLCSI